LTVLLVNVPLVTCTVIRPVAGISVGVSSLICTGLM
jgi:hypothetical protein